MSAAAQGTLFDLCGGHPALDLVNSLDNRFRADGPDEMLASYADLLRFLEESGLLSRPHVRALNKTIEPDAAARAVQSAHELREATAAVLYGILDRKEPRRQDVTVLEKHFLDAARHRELQWGTGKSGSARPGKLAFTGRAGFAWGWGRYENEPNLPVRVLAESVSDILLSPDITRVRTCAADTCRWLFLDTSKNHTRRWCNMKVCGNRMKARRFQARHDQT
jgi:predicted RNA-binding Zn ribbon-like protein